MNFGFETGPFGSFSSFSNFFVISACEERNIGFLLILKSFSKGNMIKSTCFLRLLALYQRNSLGMQVGFQEEEGRNWERNCRKDDENSS